MATTTTHEAVSSRPPLWRDAAVLKWVTQIGLLAVVVGAMLFMASQAGSNLEARAIPTGYDFIQDSVGIQLSEGIDTKPATGGRALWVGMVNTLRISAAGIVAATVLGVVVGLARLSGNWIVRKISTVFVETLRNIPLLVQIILIFAIFQTLPGLKLDSGPIHGWFHISNKGISIPRVFGLNGSFQWLAFMVIGSTAAWFTHRARVKRQDETGDITYPVLSAFAVLFAFGALGWFVHPIMGFLGPVFGAFADGLSSLREEVLQVILSVFAVLAAIAWVRRFLRSMSSGGGRAKLVDDDYFRIVFAGVAALAGVVLFLSWGGLSSWIINSGTDFFELLDDRFGSGNGGRPFDGKKPDIVKPGNFVNYGRAGLTLTPNFAAVFIGVVLYTSAFIGENVRGGILAVPKGQSEAAGAIGLSRGQSLRHVVLPQAFRIIMPPMGNQYLNLTKNTSLAIAVGYTDLVQVGTTVYNQTGKTLSVVSIWMLFYLSVSLTISVVVNYINLRLKLVER